MTKYLVTGSTGFIGNRLLGLLKTINCDVRLLARSKVDNYETVVCNLGEDRIPKHTLKSIDIVFHLAGFAHDMRNATEIEHLYQSINVDVSVRLAQLAAISSVQRFVFVSSTKAGGPTVSGACITEEQQGGPDGVYGKTKRDA
jgi:nucleoside-diphosphate-sugar epimerase